MQNAWNVAKPLALRFLKSKVRGIFRSRRVFKRRRFTKAVKKAIGYKPEFNYLDTSSGVVPAIGGTVIALNTIAQGTNYNQRIGQSILGKYISCLLWIVPPTGATVSDIVKVCLVYDKCPNGTTAGYADIFDAGGSGPAMQQKQMAKYADRFTIVQTYLARVAQGPPVMEEFFNLKFEIPEAKGKAMFASAAAATPTSGGYYLTLGSQNNTGGAAGSANVYYNCRYAWYEF